MSVFGCGQNHHLFLSERTQIIRCSANLGNEKSQTAKALTNCVPSLLIGVIKTTQGDPKSVKWPLTGFYWIITLFAGLLRQRSESPEKLKQTLHWFSGLPKIIKNFYDRRGTFQFVRQNFCGFLSSLDRRKLAAAFPISNFSLSLSSIFSCCSWNTLSRV